MTEDDPASRELLRELLERWGYEVEEACDGGEALQKIKDIMPELAILDIQMPVLDGFAVLRSIREDQRFAELPVMALTAFAMEGDKEKTLSLGFTGYQSKPLNPQHQKLEVERMLA